MNEKPLRSELKITFKFCSRITKNPVIMLTGHINGYVTEEDITKIFSKAAVSHFIKNI
jgi:hypothetical protein